RYNKLFDEAVALEPLYQYFYSNRAVFFMPRWYGREGDWERSADETREKVGGKEGSSLYGYIAWGVNDYSTDSDLVFSTTRVSWPKLKQGFMDIEALYGTNNYAVNKFCFLACQAADKQTAQALFARIGENYDPYAWHQGKTFYRYKAWAADRWIDK